MERIDYQPVGSLAVEMSVATTLVNGVVTVVRIWIRSVTSISDSTTFISDNSLVAEVNARAGLSEETEYSAYTAVSDEQRGSYYYYVVDATVSS